MKCAYNLWKWAKLIDSCNQEIKQHCGAQADCEDCFKYMDDLGVGNFSEAQMACVKKRNPTAFSDLSQSCIDASWNHTKGK